MDTKDSKNSFILIAVVVFIAAGVVYYRSLAKELDVSENASATADAPFKGPEQFISGDYKDGSYTADGGYVSPGGPEQVEIILALKNDVIEDVQFISKAKLPTSQFFQKKFESGYKELVLGKKISEVKLDKVAGSSLTPIGFNEALEKIKSQAKV